MFVLFFVCTPACLLKLQRFHLKSATVSSPLTPPCLCYLNGQIDRETGRAIGMAAILANEPSCLRAEIGEMFYTTEQTLTFLLCCVWGVAGGVRPATLTSPI